MAADGQRLRAVGDGELVAALSELRIRKTPSPGRTPYAPRSGGHRQQRAMAADRGAALSTNRQQPWSAGTATATVRGIWHTSGRALMPRRSLPALAAAALALGA